MSSYTWSPLMSAGSGSVPTYANLAAFPSPASAGNGALAIALDTDTLYISTGSAWNPIGSSSTVLSIGPFGSSPNAAGGTISSNTLTLEPADGTHPGGVSTTAQTFAGNKTFTGSISASNLSGTNTGDQTITLTGDVTGSGTGSFAATISSNAVSNSKLAQMPADTLKGNNTGGTANAADLTTSQVNTLLGTITSLTTDVVATGPGAAVATIQPNVVSNSKLAQMPTLTIKGNNTGGTANAADLTVANVNAILPVFTNTLNGLAPSSGGGTSNFLRADGTWASVSSSSGSVTSSANTLVLRDSNGNTQTNDLALLTQTITAAGSSTTISASSPAGILITPSGNNGQTINLPQGTSLLSGAMYYVYNTALGNVTVADHSNNVLGTVYPNGFLIAHLTDNTTTNGTWGIGIGGAVASAASSNSIPFRDSNANSTFNIVGTSIQSVTAANSTTTLTVSSPAATAILASGGNTQNVTMPDATTLTKGMIFYIYNYANGTSLIKDHSGTIIVELGYGGTAVCQLINNVTSAGSWASYVAYFNGNPQLISVDTIDTAAAANGLTVANTASGPKISTQSASASNPGMVNTTTQTFAGVKTFSSAPVFSGASISANTVSNSSLAQMAADTIKGNNTGSTANAADLTTTQVRALVTKAPTIQSFTSSSGTYTTPAGVSYLIVEMVGGGAGGAGGGSGSPGAGTAGNNTTFGSSFLTAGGGSAATSQSQGGLGGTNTANAGGTVIVNVAGGGGGGGGLQSTTTLVPSGAGGNSAYGGGAPGTFSGNVGVNGATNSGGGGSGGGGNNGSAVNSGGGGGAGGYLKVLISSPSATYSYAVGGTASGGAAGTNGQAGGNGAAGYIVVTEYYL